MANKGFEFAFKGSMKAYKILANKAVFWLGHVTGTGGESEAHYWANDCDTCKEIAKFISDWSSQSQPTQRTPDKCPRGGSHVYKWDGTLPTEEMIECEKCGHRR